jgi:7-cyano-7-deazaguanine synthase in queuosine biosynthesis
MLRREKLSVEGMVSQRLLNQVGRIQDMLGIFGPHFGHDLGSVPIRTTGVSSPLPAQGRGVACFFSGGLDSFFTALRHRDELDALIFVHGLDIDVRNVALREMISTRIRLVADAMGLPLVEIETDVRTFSDRSLHWILYGGPVLASLGLMLQPLFKKVYVASAYTYHALYPSGSHPIIDPLWSSDSTEIVHDGAEFNRIDKASYLADSEIVQKNLRVCYTNTHGEYNCGRCRKCTLMQLILAALGLLDRFPVFESPLTPEAVRRLDLSAEEYHERAAICLQILVARGGDPDLIHALQDALYAWIHNIGRPAPPREPVANPFQRIFPPVSLSPLYERT